MRRIIIRSISLAEYQAFRRVQAIEGYVDLGMFEEAEAELRELPCAQRRKRCALWSCTPICESDARHLKKLFPVLFPGASFS
jgi:hypothetical protein